MRNIPPYGCIVGAILLAGLLFLGYQVSSVYIKNFELQRLHDEIHPDGRSPQASEIDAHLAKVDEALARRGWIELKMLKTELLLYKAWYYPEESLQPLRQALPLGLEVYHAGEAYQSTAGWHVAWALSYAGLLSRFDYWADDVLIRAPYMRSVITHTLIESQLAQDDIDSARAIIERELRERGQSVDGRMTALMGYMVLEEYDQAEKLSPELYERCNLDADQIRALAQLSVETQHFAQAREFIADLQSQYGEEADLALLDAVAVAGLRGLDDAELPGLLETATTSTRYPITQIGCRAWVCASLSDITDEKEWAVELARLGEEYPQDYGVVAALAYQQIEQLVAAVTGGSAGNVVDIENTIVTTQEALELAPNPILRKAACLQLAITQVHLAFTQTQNNITNSEQTQELALHTLRRAFGDPEEVDAICGDCMLDYGSFLLDPAVQALRVASPEFDRGVNEAVINYLNRRIDLFNGIPQLQPLNKLLYRGTESSSDDGEEDSDQTGLQPEQVLPETVPEAHQEE